MVEQQLLAVACRGPAVLLSANPCRADVPILRHLKGREPVGQTLPAADEQTFRHRAAATYPTYQNPNWSTHFGQARTAESLTRSNAGERRLHRGAQPIDNRINVRRRCNISG